MTATRIHPGHGSAGRGGLHERSSFARGMPGLPCGLRQSGPPIPGPPSHESRIHVAGAGADPGCWSPLRRRSELPAADRGRRLVRRCGRPVASRSWWEAARRRRPLRSGGPAPCEPDPCRDRNHDHPWTRRGRVHRGPGPVRPGGHGDGGAAGRRPPPTPSRQQDGRSLRQPRPRRDRPPALCHDHGRRHRTHQPKRRHDHGRHGRGDRRRQTAGRPPGVRHRTSRGRVARGHRGGRAAAGLESGLHLRRWQRRCRAADLARRRGRRTQIAR
jgi:hypothetical protein